MAQDDAFYAKLIIDYLTKFDKASREEIDKLLWTKLSDALVHEQKSKKVANLLANLRRSEQIDNAGTRKSTVWQLAEKNAAITPRIKADETQVQSPALSNQRC